jgi:hypothetical protein
MKFTDEELAKQDREEKITLKPSEGDPKKYAGVLERYKCYDNGNFQGR